MGCTMSIIEGQFYLGVGMMSRKMIWGCLLPELPCYGPGRPRIHLFLTVQCQWGSRPFYDSNFLVPSPTNSYVRSFVIICFLCDMFLSLKKRSMRYINSEKHTVSVHCNEYSQVEHTLSSDQDTELGRPLPFTPTPRVTTVWVDIWLRGCTLPVVTLDINGIPCQLWLFGLHTTYVRYIHAAECSKSVCILIVWMFLSHIFIAIKDCCVNKPRFTYPSFYWWIFELFLVGGWYKQIQRTFFGWFHALIFLTISESLGGNGAKQISKVAVPIYTCLELVNFKKLDLSLIVPIFE